jgi:drug/metabolite transporter (DMT)-like permease
VDVVQPVPARVLGDSQERRGQIFVALGAVAWSSAGLLQRDLSVGPATQLGGRAFFAMISLFVYVVVFERGDGVVQAFRGIGRAGLAVAACMAISSTAFIIALNHSSVARLLFITALAPLVAALLARVALGERVEPRTWAAMLIALLGVALMLEAGAGGTRLGDLLAAICTLSFAAAIVITRHRRDISMAPATCLSQLACLAVAIPFMRPGSADGRDIVLLVLLGAGQIGLGLALLTTGARLIPAAQTALISLLELVLAPIWVWLAYSEQPDNPTLIGGGIVLVAVIVQTSDPGRLIRRAQPASCEPGSSSAVSP